jgi:DNA-binding NarL/FixJ family response regulator
MPIKLVVVDDEALIRAGFEMILNAEPDIDVVATCDGVRAVETITRLSPNVVLLDVRMPVVDGLTVLRELRRVRSKAKIAMLTTFDADGYLAAALRDGASGFLLKDTNPQDLPQMIRTLAAGGLVLSASVGHRVATGYLSDRGSDADRRLIDSLSEREKQVLARLATGASNPEIAAGMHLSATTVKDYVSTILTKLNCTSRVQAALIAERAGLMRRTTDR